MSCPMAEWRGFGGASEADGNRGTGTPISLLRIEWPGSGGASGVDGDGGTRTPMSLPRAEWRGSGGASGADRERGTRAPISFRKAKVEINFFSVDEIVFLLVELAIANQDSKCIKTRMEMTIM